MKLYRHLIISLLAIVNSAFALKESSRSIVLELFTLAGKQERIEQLQQAHELIQAIHPDAPAEEYARALECIIASDSVFTDLVVVEKAFEVLIKLIEAEKLGENRVKQAILLLQTRQPAIQQRYKLVNISPGNKMLVSPEDLKNTKFKK
ncbi:MAG: hypothetical protein K2X90_00315 [Candidatus Babeliaceae bacterium]|nr:hypothetical protein [Candidatus Babeliaceae bacterium]